MSQLAEALQYLLPGVQYSCGNAYESIVIHDEGVDIPSQEAIAAAYVEIERSNLLKSYVQALTQHLDETAKSKDYEGSLSIATYVSSTNQQWAAEAAAFILWRDQCWIYAYNKLQEIELGAEVPKLEDFVDNIPAINWP